MNTALDEQRKDVVCIIERTNANNDKEIVEKMREKTSANLAEDTTAQLKREGEREI